jgi:DNA-binding CsgD family transcriptional regulator
MSQASSPPGAAKAQARSDGAGGRDTRSAPSIDAICGLLSDLKPDPETNIQTIVEKAYAIFGGNSACYCRFENGRTLLRAWRGKFGAYTPKSSKPLEAALCYSALKSSCGRPKVLENLQNPSVDTGKTDISHIGCTSFLGCPITRREEVVGAICIFDGRERDYTPDELQLVALLAKSLALEEARIEKSRALKTAVSQTTEALTKSNARLEAEVKEHKLTIRRLKAREKELARKKSRLQDMNNALTVMFKKRNDDIDQIEKQMVHNIRDLIDPALQRLKGTGLKASQQKWLEVLEANLNDIASPLAAKLASGYQKLTPTEIKIASFIKHGNTNKEIARLLNISDRTVEVHRCNIRKKLGIRNRDMNLRTYLLSME